jgi:thiopeptide-type bacteriocin biosynthesis protein
MWADNHILLDRTHSFHLKEIAHRLKNDPKSSIILMEKKGKEEWVKSEKGMHRSEFVVPFHKNQHYFSSSTPTATYTPVPISSRWKTPGSEWFYAKIYLPRDNEARFLTSCLAPIIEGITEDIKTWFYIRYREGEATHIRLRCQLKEIDDISVFLKKFHAWSNSLMQKGWIKDVHLASYEREVERYGGEILIDKAEAFFQVDSEACLSFLQLIVLKKTSLPEPILATLSLIYLLEGFGLSLEKQQFFFSQMDLKRENLEGFREWKVKLISMISILKEEDLASKNEELYAIFKIFKERKEKQTIYAIALQENAEAHLILQSIIHMHCNRLMGVDHLLEQKAYNYAAHTLSIVLRKNVLTQLHCL